MRNSIPIVLVLLLLACQPIVVRVGKRTQAAEVETSVPYASKDVAAASASWNSVEDFLQNLDDIKQAGRDALLKRYHENGRAQIRSVFRQFRDTVEDHSRRDPSHELPYLGGFQAGTCVPIRVRDVFDLGPYGDLRALLETVFLAKLKPTDAVSDPSSPGDIDELAKLGFFELGIMMDGSSYSKTEAKVEIQGSDLDWQVIHEQTEPAEWAVRDERLVHFRFVRTHQAPDRNDFVLEAHLGDDDVRPALSITYQRIQDEAGTSYQDLLIRTGLRDALDVWQEIQLSRRVLVTQDIQQGRILHVSAAEHFEQPNEQKEKFRLDMDAQNLCSEVTSE